MSDKTETIDEAAGEARFNQTRLDVFSIFEGPHTIGSSDRFWLGFLVVVALLFIYPVTASEFGILRSTTLMVWVFLSLSLTICWGYAGIFSFGQTAFFGLGGYTFGVVGTNLLPVTGGTNLVLLAAIMIPAAGSAAIGYFMFYGRVSGVYVAIITLAVTLIFELLFSRTAGPEYAIGDVQLGGYNGMTGIPDLTLGAGPVAIELGTVGTFYFVVGLLIAIYLVLRYVLNSNYGYLMVATRESESRTSTLGYDTRLVKLQVFTIAGGVAGLGGALYASTGNFISPPIMGLAFAALPVIWITVGGRKTIIGAIVGTLVIRGLSNQLASAGSQYAIIFVGLILLLSVLLLPRGAVPTINQYLQQRFNTPIDDNS
jgi:branched-chain amino acid transport system permease protein